MAKYTPHTPTEIEQMLHTVGVKQLDDLFCDVPRDIFKPTLHIGEGNSEYETEMHLRLLANKNSSYSAVLSGGGIYDHIIPAAVKAIASNPQFVTAYTPYQPEISQGVLQSIFEYQTQVCLLTGMDVSNASVYDGGTAVAEAVIMCCERKHKAIILGDINPQYMQVVTTYCFAHNVTLVHIASKDGHVDKQAFSDSIDDDTACVIAQCPNYYGLIEDMGEIGTLAHEKNVKFIYVFNPIASALLPTPASCGADIAVAEGQPLGLPMYMGGATLGLLACTKAMSRRMPGRVVGQTTDKNGERCFVLTLQAREQHIRREKALSSICSNQALFALRASAYLNCVGKEGLCEIATRCVDNAHYLAEQLVNNGAQLAYTGEFFHEFVIKGGARVVEALRAKGILGGIVLDNGDTLWCTTEKLSRATLDTVVDTYAEVVK